MSADEKGGHMDSTERTGRVESPELSRREARPSWITRLSSGYGVPRYQLIEVSQLERHILTRIYGIEGATMANESLRKDWIASRFTYPLRELMLKAARNGRSNVALNLVVVGGGFATSGVAVAKQGSATSDGLGWAVFAIGLLVALAGGLNQLYRPGYRASERSSLVLQLEEEGWAFANASKPYDKSELESIELFDKNISAVLRRAAGIAAQSVPSSGTRKR